MAIKKSKKTAWQDMYICFECQGNKIPFFYTSISITTKLLVRSICLYWKMFSSTSMTRISHSNPVVNLQSTIPEKQGCQMFGLGIQRGNTKLPMPTFDMSSLCQYYHKTYLQWVQFALLKHVLLLCYCITVTQLQNYNSQKIFVYIVAFHRSLRY